MVHKLYKQLRMESGSMNDRFKYRCWDKQIKKMRYGDIQLSCSGLPFTLEATSEGLKVVDIDNIEIMQSTGIKDRNGKLIYEGDIVKSEEYPFKSNDKYNYSAEICWAKDSAQFFYYVFKNKDSEVVGRSTGNTGSLEEYEWEIIGNIYENPELLEETCN